MDDINTYVALQWHQSASAMQEPIRFKRGKTNYFDVRCHSCRSGRDLSYDGMMLKSFIAPPWGLVKNPQWSYVTKNHELCDKPWSFEKIHHGAM